MNENIKSKTLKIGRQTYFFNLKVAKNDNKYIVITEKRFIPEGEFQKGRIIFFEEAFDEFIDAIIELTSEVYDEVTIKHKPLNYEEIRKTYPNAYMPWTLEDDEKLELLYCERTSISTLSKVFGRKRGAILSRIKKLELSDKYDLE